MPDSNEKEHSLNVSKKYEEAVKAISKFMGTNLRSLTSKLDKTLTEPLGGGENGVFGNLIYKGGHWYRRYIVEDGTEITAQLPKNIETKLNNLPTNERKYLSRQLEAGLSSVADTAEGELNRLATRAGKFIGAPKVLPGAAYKVSQLGKWAGKKAYGIGRAGFRKLDGWTDGRASNTVNWGARAVKSAVKKVLNWL